MCLIALALGASERFPFVVAANRDEFLDRPTAPLALWQSPAGATVLSGRDLRDGGIWMGFAANGRFAMLTNVRDPLAQAPEQPISRGGLALSWLESTLPVETWSETVQAARYAGFNLIVGDWQKKSCHYLSNQHIFKPFKAAPVIKYENIATNFVASQMPWNSISGLSNAALNTPWPKTVALQSALRHALEAKDQTSMTAQALQALASRELAADLALPSTGLPLEMERALSSAFVCHPQDAPLYGTRSSLVAVFSAEQGLQVTELTHSERGLSSQSTQALLGWR